jgi:hypothetical protein
MPPEPLATVPAPSFSIADAQLIEGNTGLSNMLFTVTLTGTPPDVATVQYQTTDASASFGADLLRTAAGTLSFNPGETVKVISIPIVGDLNVEPDEVFHVSLFNPVNATIARGDALGTILNDDGGGSIIASDVRVAEGNSGTTNAVITLTASTPFTGEVDFFTVDGTAKSGSDYTPRTSFVTFNHETTKTITIPILGDTQPEPDETFTVRLSIDNYRPGAASVSLTRQFVTVTIVNDDTGVGPDRLVIRAGTSTALIVNLASVSPQDVTFTSSDSSIARIQDTAHVTGSTFVGVFGVTPGNATITASLPPGFGPPVTIDVFVYDRADLVMGPLTVSMAVGDTATIHASFIPPLTVAETSTLSTAGLGVVTFPDHVTVDPGDTATFMIKAISRGEVNLNATLGTLRANDVSSVTIDIVDRITTPYISAMLPDYTTFRSGTGVVIRGANFRPECTMTFDGVPATDVHVISDTLMTVRTPSHPSNVVDAALVCGFDLFTRPYFFYFGTTAELYYVRPAVGTTHGKDVVMIEGANFFGGCWPFFGGLPARGSRIGGSFQIVAATPPHEIGGRVPVSLRCTGAPDVVLNDGGNGGFLYGNANVLTPRLGGVYPSFGPPGTHLSVSGENLRLDDAVAIGGIPVTVDSQGVGYHYVRIPDLPPGDTTLTVTDYRGAVSPAQTIKVLEPVVPRIDSVTPTEARPDNEVRLLGTGFRTSQTFLIGGQVAFVVRSSFSDVLLRVPTVAAGAYAIRVVNKASVVEATGPKLTVLPAGLGITRVSPVCTATEGGGRMTVYGSGFVPGAVVTFSRYIGFDPSTDAAGTDAVVSDGHAITFTIPSLQVGLQQVTVINPNGDSASLSNALSAVSPFDPDGCSPRPRGARH